MRQSTYLGHTNSHHTDEVLDKYMLYFTLAHNVDADGDVDKPEVHHGVADEVGWPDRIDADLEVKTGTTGLGWAVSCDLLQRAFLSLLRTNEFPTTASLSSFLSLSCSVSWFLFHFFFNLHVPINLHPSPRKTIEPFRPHSLHCLESRMGVVT